MSAPANDLTPEDLVTLAHNRAAFRKTWLIPRGKRWQSTPRATKPSASSTLSAWELRRWTGVVWGRPLWTAKNRPGRPRSPRPTPGAGASACTAS